MRGETLKDKLNVSYTLQFGSINGSSKNSSTSGAVGGGGT